MVRARVKPTVASANPLRATYTPANLVECARLVNEENYTPAEARKVILDTHGEEIPKGTLAGWTRGVKQADGSRKVHTKDSKHGHPRHLSADDEQELYNMVVHACELGFPITRDTIRETAWHLDMIAAELEQREPRFGENGPHNDWVERYWCTWKLSDRATLDKEPKRTSALNANVVRETFALWDKACNTGYNGGVFPLGRRYNMDEFGKRSRCAKQRKGVFPQGWKDACSRTGAGTRDTFTGMSTNSPTGNGLDLTFIFGQMWRGTPNQKAIMKACEGWAHVAWQESGYMMTMEYFKAWLRWFAIQVKATPNDPVLLALDGHASRISLLVWKYALSLGIKLFIFPGGITSHIQPQDVGVLGPFTRTLGKKYSKHCNSSQPLTTVIFLKMIKEVCALPNL